jgi:hypothetical protein
MGRVILGNVNAIISNYIWLLIKYLLSMTGHVSLGHLQRGDAFRTRQMVSRVRLRPAADMKLVVFKCVSVCAWWCLQCGNAFVRPHELGYF